jgi:hypothetical protein
VEGEGRLDRRSISAKAVVADIKKGLSDSELMNRHELNQGQLQKIFAQLIKAGYVAKEAVEERGQKETAALSSEPPRPVLPKEDTPKPSPRQVSKPAAPQPSSRSLPLSREEAGRFSRNGLFLIFASYVLWTMGGIFDALARRADPESFLRGELMGLLLFLSGIGGFVTVILGCLWRVRGLGQHPAWAVVAPLFWLNIIVMVALPNRYEPESGRRGLWLGVSVLVMLLWIMMLTLFIKNRMGL